MRPIALFLLRLAERTFLLANGWKMLPDGMWEPPPTYAEHKRYPRTHGHAVNSQKYWTFARTVSKDLYVTRVGGRWPVGRWAAGHAGDDR